MLISFDCPRCLKPAYDEVTLASHNVNCDACQWTRPINEGERKGESPVCCLVCGCSDLWRQKDFNQRLGVAIVGLGIVLSTIAVAYMMPGVAMLVLMIFGLADWILYAILPDRLVCYRCHTRYRKIPTLVEVQGFDLEVNERYRQESIRLKKAGTQ